MNIKYYFLLDTTLPIPYKLSNRLSKVIKYLSFYFSRSINNIYIYINKD